jgi:ArsR family transcriptional regulator
MSVKLIQEIDATCCAPLTKAPLAQDQAERLAAALRVVADPTRLRLVSLIANCPDATSCVCELTEPLGLSQPTVSHHLKVLHASGILDREKRGRWVYYRLNGEPLRLLRETLDPTPVTREREQAS